MARFALGVVLLLLATDARAGPFRNGSFWLTPAFERTDRSHREMATFPFDTPGCYPSGSVVGTRGETITVSRTSIAGYVDREGNVGTCQPNEARVSCRPSDLTQCGLVIEGARIQRYPTPLAPAAATITLTSTGFYRFWVAGGTGSQTLSNAGTASIIGAPCTASQGAPCMINVPSLGANPLVSFSDVTGGTLTMAQFEGGQTVTSIIPTVGTMRAAETVSISNPLTNKNPQDWWVTVTVTNERGWNLLCRPLSSGTLGQANTWAISIQGSADMTVRQSPSNYWAQSTASQSWAAGTMHKLTAGGGRTYACLSRWGDPVGTRGGNASAFTLTHPATIDLGTVGQVCECYMRDLQFGYGPCRQ